jgi:serine phosphatase RsbU (regulator of sigma subunit)/pSer/pThr/pTyr-binding forkhead associated (FHA) protein
MTRELLVRAPDGTSRTLKLENARVAVGRASACELCFPDDIGLSRNHLAFEPAGDGWNVLDSASKNGTYVNGERLNGPYTLKPGDRVTAGHLTIEYLEGREAAPQHTVVFIDEKSEPVGSTVVTSLKQVLNSPVGSAEPDSPQHSHALIRAGRELAGHRPLDELFPVILSLAVEAVNASRGVLVTVENGELVTRAARGDGFRISAAVRDSVLNDKTSLLVRDAQLEEAFKNRMSIVQQQVRSMMAVPLEANDRVIGLIYVDSPTFLMPFTKQDLNLLTVMANVAAIRIEHARLIQVEQAERLMAKDLDQAAEIQRRLLPSGPPSVPGVDVAGYNAPSRTVGGDYYDFFPYPDGRIGLLVADVAGKGMPAAMMMSSLQSRMEVLAEDPDDLAEITTRLNRAIKKTAPANRFITFFFCVLDPATGVLDYCNAGHNPPLVIRDNGSVEKLTGGGLPLGLFPHAQYQQERAHLSHGDVLVLYSDGVSEAPRPGDEEEFGEDHLGSVLSPIRELSAAEMVDRVNREVADWTQGAPPADDITLLIARRLP